MTQIMKAKKGISLVWSFIDPDNHGLGDLRNWFKGREIYATTSVIILIM